MNDRVPNMWATTCYFSKCIIRETMKGYILTQTTPHQSLLFAAFQKHDFYLVEIMLCGSPLPIYFQAHFLSLAPLASRTGRGKPGKGQGAEEGLKV